MEKEFEFWIKNRTASVSVNGEVFNLAHYDVEVDAPRPGSFYHIFALMKLELFDEEKEFKFQILIYDF